MISILTTNIFSGNEHLDLFFKCLGNQTCQDFELILMDGHYYKNRRLISDLSIREKIINVKHYPACGATHFGHRFHWSWYNNAFLLASNDLFIRMGVYRWFHSRTIETAIEQYSNGVFVDFSHITTPIDDFRNLSAEQIDEKFNPKQNSPKNFMTCSSGMFSCTKDIMLQINGNDEVAITMVHHEDSDLNSRWIHLKDLKSMTIDNSMLRMEHHKAPSDIIPELEQKNSFCCGKQFCLLNYPNTFDLNHNPPTQDYKFEYRGFTWKYCPDCNAMAPLNSDEYLIHLRKNSNPVASIGVKGIAGRDLRILNEDISILTDDQDKLALLRDSHDNQRYLFDTEEAASISKSRFTFSRNLKSVCDEKKIKFIDHSMLYSAWRKDQQIKKNNRKMRDYIIDCIDKYDENIFICDLLQNYTENELNIIFKTLHRFSQNLYISMISREDEECINPDWKNIQWWDQYISNSQYFYSDAEESNIFRKYFDEEDKKYLNCFFILKTK